MSDVTILEQLMELRSLLNLPNSWTQGTSARDVKGDPCSPQSKDAVCFCLYGAAAVVQKRMAGHENSNFGSFIEYMRRGVMGKSHLNFASFNDDPNTNHVTIVDFIDDMIHVEKEYTQRMRDLLEGVKAL